MADDNSQDDTDSTDYSGIFSVLGGMFPGAQTTPVDPSQQTIAAQLGAAPQQAPAPLAAALANTGDSPATIASNANQAADAKQDASDYGYSAPDTQPTDANAATANAPYDVRTEVYNSLISRGVGSKAAAGFVGGMMGESGAGLNPNAYNPNDNGGPSGGIAQWHNDRFAGLNQFAAGQGTTWKDPATQVGFLNAEFDGPYKGVIDKLKSDDSVANGVKTNVYDFEKPADQAGQVVARSGLANQLGAFVDQNGGQLPAGQFKGGGGGGGGGGSAAPADATAYAGAAPSAANAPASQAITSAMGGGNGGPMGGGNPLSGLMNGLGIGSLMGNPGNPGFGQSGGMADMGRRLGMVGMALAARDNPAAWGAYASLANNNTNQNDVSQSGYVKNSDGTISPVYTDKMGNTRVGAAMPQGYSNSQLDANGIKQQQLDNQTIMLQARQAQLDAQQEKMRQGMDVLNQHDGLTAPAYTKLQQSLITPQNNVTNSQQLIDQGDQIIKDIDNGNLDPSYFNNNLANLRNMAGDSTPQSRAIKNLLSYKENAVNFYGQQNKGGGSVSRDQREADAFLPAGGQYDAAAIREGITRLNGRATAIMNNNINTLNSTYNTAPHLNMQMSGQPAGTMQKDYYNSLSTKYSQADTARQAATDAFSANYHKAPGQSQAAPAAGAQQTPAQQGYGGFLGGAAPAATPAPAAAPAQAPAGPATIKSQSDYNSLPVGATYVNPKDGKTYTKGSASSQ